MALARLIKGWWLNRRLKWAYLATKINCSDYAKEQLFNDAQEFERLKTLF